MSDKEIVEYASPTLAGLKTGCLFGQNFAGEEEMRRQIREYNRRFAGTVLCLIPLQYCGGRALLYLYRPERLRGDFQEPQVGRLLRQDGYQICSTAACLLRLADRISRERDTGGFPHEIGLFLGYPPEDVEGFILQGPRHCKCTGYWKVYGDVDGARRTFRKYRCCTDCYRKQLARGVPLERLTVRGKTARSRGDSDSGPAKKRSDVRRKTV